MADLADLPGTQYGLAQYLAAKQAFQNQDQKDQFLQQRAALGPTASSEQLIGLAQRYASPSELMHYGQASLDRREATAARLQTAHELAQYRLDNLQRQREADLARVKTEEGRQALTDYYKNAELNLKQYQTDTSSELKRLGIDIQQQNADTNRMRAEATAGKKDEPLQNMLDKIDTTKRMIQSNPEAVGGRGMLGRAGEFIGGIMDPAQETPASNLQTQILDLQTTYRGLPGHAASRLKIDAANIDKLIKGLGVATNAPQAIGSLDTLRDTIAKQLERRAGAVDAPQEDTPSEAPQETSKFLPAPMNPSERIDGMPYTTPKGVLRWNKKRGKWLAP